jgi:hypothetical protein
MQITGRVKREAGFQSYKVAVKRLASDAGHFLAVARVYRYPAQVERVAVIFPCLRRRQGRHVGGMTDQAHGRRSR